ncbi:MAG: DUF934 domain-containing protein [Rhodocyclaceae bacterium]|nr:DUF934 domain-containing protein [Rhodocyclaceae bacterium]MCA3073955.1 DUF934 domain-containing protein [Rhodocyclaceae bacterium]MCA3089326.1 DUF934 domain-containing protein [Rhodocyclaceae bacterium]MCA3092887.1 DUF934 domain-containing protein [Rhodocyclaceae bacterium]MCA3097022.1 DUF934 domain-containing protein [Rhodocyclaceae bacterium]
MHSLISRQAVVTVDPWCVLVGGVGDVPAGIDLLVPLQVWLDARFILLERQGRVGVRLEPGDDPALIAGDVDCLSLVAVNFPSFTDGRGFSIARLLRERHGWRGELRAIGPLTRDVLFYLARCGFDSFELREGEDLAAALSEFAAFDEVYQGAGDRAAPFDRTASAGAAGASA